MADESSTNPAEPEILAELRELTSRAKAEDATALPRIREILNERPEIWRHVGDLSSMTERAWIAAHAAENPLAVESLKRSVAEMRAELAGEHPTRLERILVDQVIATYLEAKYLESVTASATKGTLDQSALRLRRLESAQRRQIAAINALTTLRTLEPTAVAPAPTIKMHEEEERHRA